MANTYNYATDITKLRGPYKKYMASRIIDNPKNKLLELEVPASVPENFVLEVMFYSVAENYLLSSVVLTSDDTEVITTTTLQYPDTSIRKLLFIDFSKFNINIEQGRLQIVINFFVPEVGGYDSSKFSITKISPSRQEIEMSLLPQCITPEIIEELRLFATPQINSTWVTDALRYVYNQTQSMNPDIPTDKTPLSFDILQEFLPTDIKKLLNDPDTDSQFVEGVKNLSQQILNVAYGYATQSISTELSTHVYTKERLNTIVSESIAYSIRSNEINSSNKQFSVNRPERIVSTPLRELGEVIISTNSSEGILI